MNELSIKLGRRFCLETNQGQILLRLEKFQFPIQHFKWVGFWKKQQTYYEASRLMYFWQDGEHANLPFWPMAEKRNLVSFGQCFNEEGDNGANGFEHTEIIISTEDAKKIKTYVESFKPIYLRKDSFHEEVKVRKPIHLAENIWVNNDYIIYTRRSSKKSLNVDCVYIPSICFFCEKHGFVGNNVVTRFIYNLLGLSAGSIYFGAEEQITIGNPETGLGEKLLNYAKERDAYIGIDISNVKTHKSIFRWANIFKPKYWHVQEEISFVDDAILFIQRGKRYVDTMYLPFDNCYIVMHTKGITRQRLCIFGTMNVITKQCFSKDVVNTVISEAKKHGLDGSANGTKMHPSWLWFRWFLKVISLGLLRNAQIVEGDRIFLFTPGSKGEACTFANNGLGDKLKGSLAKTKKVFPKDCSTITFYKEHWYSLFGRIELQCETKSIRADQTESAGGSATLYHVWVFKGKKWANGNVVTK